MYFGRCLAEHSDSTSFFGGPWQVGSGSVPMHLGGEPTRERAMLKICFTDKRWNASVFSKLSRAFKGWTPSEIENNQRSCETKILNSTFTNHSLISCWRTFQGFSSSFYILHLDIVEGCMNLREKERSAICHLRLIFSSVIRLHVLEIIYGCTLQLTHISGITKSLATISF